MPDGAGIEQVPVRLLCGRQPLLHYPARARQVHAQPESGATPCAMFENVR